MIAYLASMDIRSGGKFFDSRDPEWEELGGGVARKILGWDDQIMMVKVKFEKGSIGATHSHIHTQVTYCASGRFEFTIGTDKKIVCEGDSLYVAPNIEHGAVCLEKGMLIDVFSPVREDFL